MTQKIFTEYLNFVNKNRNLRPKFECIPLTKQQNSFQYVGGQIIDGHLYSIVNGAEKMLKYDTIEAKMDFLGDFEKKDFKWTGGCIYENKLYAFPRVENDLLLYCPQTDSFEKIPGCFKYEGEHHYGGVCTNDGIIYQPPRDTDHILKWDIKKKTCEKIHINNGAQGRYCGSVIHPNGYAYFIPEKDFCVIKMDLKTEKTEYIGAPIIGMTFNPIVAPDGNMYGFRSGNNASGKGILKIDTANNKVSVLYEDCVFGAYGTKCGINGKIYSLPGYTNDIWELDPFSNELKKCYSLNKSENVHYAGGATDLNGDIYALPVKADNILKISFGQYGMNIPDDIYNAFFKDFY